MKNILLIVLIGFSLISCQERAAETEEITDPNLEAFERNTETVKQFFEAFIQKDITKMRSYITDDFIISPPSVGMDSLGIEQWQEMEQGFMDSYDDITYNNSLYFAGLDDNQKPNGDVRTYGLWNFTHLASGREGAVKYYAVFFFNVEGKITAHMQWYDTKDLVPAEPESVE